MNTSISKRRKEMKLELAEGNKKTLVDNFLNWIGRGRSISTWMSMIVIFLLTMLIGLIIAFISGELADLYGMGRNLPAGLAIWGGLTLFASTASMLLANVFFHRVIAVLRNQVLDTVESHETLDDIRSWVDLAGRSRFIVTLAVFLGGIVSGVYIVAILRNLLGSVNSFGLTVLLGLFSMQSSIFVGFILITLILSLRIRHFELRLFESDPASSEVIARLSGLFSSFVYLVALYGALQTFGIVRSGLMTYYAALLVLFWTPIVGIFIASQLSFATIIQRAKWKTLNSLQQKIAAIQREQALPQKDDREILLWLLDYHERVKATRNSALDLSSGVGFLNSMLLPIIAVILGNIDSLLKLFPVGP